MDKKSNDKELLENAQALDEGRGAFINDDHENFNTNEYSGVLKENAPGYRAELKALKASLAPDYEKAKAAYEAFCNAHPLPVSDPSLSKEENDRIIANAKNARNEAKANCYKDVDDKFKAGDAALKAKYEEEIKYHIHPKLHRKHSLINSDVLLSVRHLKQFFFFGNKLHNQKLKAVSNVSFDVKKGECFGIVGESGCGKTTTGRTIIKLYNPTSGSIYYRGYRIGAGSRWNEKEIKWNKIRTKKAISELKQKCDSEINALEVDSVNYEDKKAEILHKYEAQINEKKEALKAIVSQQKKKIAQIKFDQKHTPKKLMNEIQMIFQDPVDSLDSRMTVEDIIQEGLIIQGKKNRAENHKKVVEMLEKVGLVEEHASRYPHEFSGGQRQRIGIARALVMNPSLLICDEPISALDVSIRAQVINLLNDLKDEMGLTLIFIAHDLSVVKYFCDRIAVMYFGKLVEEATSDELFKHPLHPYTKSLLSAIPKPNPLTERNRTRIIYNPMTAHDYSSDLPTLKEVCPNHIVYCNDKEFEDYKKEIQETDKKSEK